MRMCQNLALVEVRGTIVPLFCSGLSIEECLPSSLSLHFLVCDLESLSALSTYMHRWSCLWHYLLSLSYRKKIHIQNTWPY
ncbi:hypothetical protein SLEP1_g43146 [Rubroshorea leprosula]|uniref:Uncharacterized protein n=1 Tax=Rubroshorea leprosula TaxID=152421 RepID=A0AAV5LC34_9ROSI|nr:hypothetical protein SLEP1_g43146 [Rubroshorea leprosula]